MTFKELGERLLGGALPNVPKPGREIHPFDGTTYTIELVWFRRRFTATYHTPRHPFSVRMKDARNLAEQVIRRYDAGETPVQVGDIWPGHRRYMPAQVQRFRDCEGGHWRRATDEERAALDYGHDWLCVHLGHNGQEQISGYCTDEGALDYAPLTFLEIREDVPA